MALAVRMTLLVFLVLACVESANAQQDDAIDDQTLDSMIFAASRASAAAAPQPRERTLPNVNDGNTEKQEIYTTRKAVFEGTEGIFLQEWRTDAIPFRPLGVVVLKTIPVGRRHALIPTFYGPAYDPRDTVLPRLAVIHEFDETGMTLYAHFPATLGHVDFEFARLDPRDAALRFEGPVYMNGVESAFCRLTRIESMRELLGLLRETQADLLDARPGVVAEARNASNNDARLAGDIQEVLRNPRLDEFDASRLRSLLLQRSANEIRREEAIRDALDLETRLRVLDETIEELSASYEEQSIKTEEWIEYTPAVVQQAIDEGYVVAMNFTADWCINCKVLEKSVLNVGEAHEQLKSDDVVMIKVDVTVSSAPGWDALKAFGRTGIPTLAIWSNGNAEEPWIRDAYDNAAVVEAIESARRVADR